MRKQCALRFLKRWTLLARFKGRAIRYAVSIFASRCVCRSQTMSVWSSEHNAGGTLNIFLLNLNKRQTTRCLSYSYIRGPNIFQSSWRRVRLLIFLWTTILARIGKFSQLSRILWQVKLIPVQRVILKVWFLNIFELFLFFNLLWQYINC